MSLSTIPGVLSAVRVRGDGPTTLGWEITSGDSRIPVRKFEMVAEPGCLVSAKFHIEAEDGTVEVVEYEAATLDFEATWYRVSPVVAKS